MTVLLEAALDDLAAAGQSVKIYTCGPEAMMAAVAALAAARGVPCEVSLETPMACGYGVCLGCPVPRAPRTKEGWRPSRLPLRLHRRPVRRRRGSIDWAGGRR